jgi:membrane-associated phospholipid phosphatase
LPDDTLGRVLRPAAVLLALSLALPARAEPRELRLDAPVSLATTGGALTAVLAAELLKPWIAPPACRICGTDALDGWARDALRWRDAEAAARASDVLLAGVPLLAGGALALSAARAGGGRTAGEDLLMVGEATSLALLATEVAKLAAGRARPYAWADPAAARDRDAFLSFWSGHAAVTFAAASAAGTVARLRGYRSWPWITGLGLAGAAGCGWLRIAGDRHWALDVLAGAAVGSLAGFGLPVWLHGRRGAGAAPAGAATIGFAGAF